MNTDALAAAFASTRAVLANVAPNQYEEKTTRRLHARRGTCVL
jgi:hypothetical protein